MLTLLATILALTQPPANDRPFPLLVGDTAPPMPVKYYLRGERQDTLEPGKPYIIEFWATWCAPCIAGFPHLTEVQKKYKGRATIIAVSVWEPRPQEVPAFIDKQGDRMGFLAAMDDCPPAPADVDNPSEWAKANGKMSITWLKASGADGIPTTFIVDAQNRIAWIGSPRDMDTPLDQIVNGTWDLDSFARAHLVKMRLRAKAQPFQVQQFQARHRQDWNSALVALDALLALDPSFAHYTSTKFEVLLTGVKDTRKAYFFAREAVNGLAKDNAEALHRIARLIVSDVSDDRDLELALTAAQRAETLTSGKDSAILGTLASVHSAKGAHANAVGTQRRAVAQADADSKADAEAKLAEYEARARKESR